MDAGRREQAWTTFLAGAGLGPGQARASAAVFEDLALPFMKHIVSRSGAGAGSADSLLDAEFNGDKLKPEAVQDWQAAANTSAESLVARFGTSESAMGLLDMMNVKGIMQPPNGH